MIQQQQPVPRETFLIYANAARFFGDTLSEGEPFFYRKITLKVLHDGPILYFNNHDIEAIAESTVSLNGISGPIGFAAGAADRIEHPGYLNFGLPYNINVDGPSSDDLTFIGLLVVDTGVPLVEGTLYIRSLTSQWQTLFVRLECFKGEKETLDSLVRVALSENKYVYSMATSHSGRYVILSEPETEIEKKINVEGEPGTYALASQFYDEINLGNMPNYHLEFLNELQVYRKEVHLHEQRISGKDAGYIAFTKEPMGGYYVKVKDFTEDTLVRREYFPGRLATLDNLDEYFSVNFPDRTFRSLGSFKRLKYEFNLESLSTGHIYSLGFDETVSDAGQILRQIEVEYMRTRVFGGSIEVPIADDIDEVLGMLTEFLERNHIRSHHSFLSKMTFLKMGTVS